LWQQGSFCDKITLFMTAWLCLWQYCPVWDSITFFVTALH